MGTPPNILAAEVLAEGSDESLSLFDFTPIGLALLGVGILFMTTIGRRLLPSDTLSKGAQEASRLTTAYRIEDRLTEIRVPKGSALDGVQLREAKIGRALDVRVLSVKRGSQKYMAPGPDFELHGGDTLLVDGKYRDLRQLLTVEGISVEETDAEHLEEVSHRVRGVVLRLRKGSGLVRRTLAELRFRHRFGVLVVGVRRKGETRRHQLGQLALEENDELLVLASHEQLEALAEQKAFEFVGTEVPASDLLKERLFHIAVSEGSTLAGLTVGESRIGELSGLTIVGILRRGETLLVVSVDEVIQAEDELLIAGEPDRVLDLLELGNLELLSKAARQELESEEVSVVEAVVAPRSEVVGSSIRELRFRDRYQLQVLALWRKGGAIHRDLPSQVLRLGDALLLHGPRDKVHLLSDDPDFVLLGGEVRPPRRSDKAWVALGSLGVMIAMVVSGAYPIHIAAFAGAVTSVLFGALTMEEAYRSIEWKALFLVAAILPVGGAMESSRGGRPHRLVGDQPGGVLRRLRFSGRSGDSGQLAQPGPRRRPDGGYPGPGGAVDRRAARGESTASDAGRRHGCLRCVHDAVQSQGQPAGDERRWLPRHGFRQGRNTVDRRGLGAHRLPGAVLFSALSGGACCHSLTSRSRPPDKGLPERSLRPGLKCLPPRPSPSPMVAFSAARDGVDRYN